MAEIERYLIGRVELGKTTTGKPVVDLYAADGRLQFPVLRLFDLSLLQTVGIDPNNLGAEPVYNRFWAYYVEGEKENRQGRRYKDVQYLEMIDKLATTTSVDNSALLAELRGLAQETRAVRALLQTLVVQNAGEAPPPNVYHTTSPAVASSGAGPEPESESKLNHDPKPESEPAPGTEPEPDARPEPESAPKPGSRPDIEPDPEESEENELETFFPRLPRSAAMQVPAGINEGQSLGWLLEHNRPYLERIANEAQNDDLRQAAAGVLDWSRNGEGLVRSCDPGPVATSPKSPPGQAGKSPTRPARPPGQS